MHSFLTFPRPFKLAVLSTVASTAVVASTLTPVVAEPSADRSELPDQTQLVGSLWDNVRPLIDRDSLGDDKEFYTAPEDVDLQSTDPGTVLRERTVPYHVAGIETPLDAIQILYATTNLKGEVEPNVTTVIAPPGGKGDGNVVSYQSAYDSANPKDNPSRIIAGNMTLGGMTSGTDGALITPALLAGHPVVLADVEGAGANFAAGPMYGHATLDSLRAAAAAERSPVTATDKIGFTGYSGGAIATSWASALMPSYAPEFIDRTVGVAEGGVLVKPTNNIDYAGDSVLWAGVVGFALATLTEAYEVDVEKYFTPYGQAVLADLADLSILEAAARYPSLHWSDIAKPEFPTPESAPEVKAVIDEINLGNQDAPQVPMFVGQGNGGTWEGTSPHDDLGSGDGIMVTGDVRAVVNQYCEEGTPVEYREYDNLSHSMSIAPWLAEAYPWLEGRFNGAPVTENCDSVPSGNEL